MAYDDSAFRRRDPGVDPLSRDTRFAAGSDLQSEPEFRTPNYQVSQVSDYGVQVNDYREPDTAVSTLSMPPARHGASPVLDDVFDDPEHGDPGRDRMVIHLMWEFVLLLAAAAAAYLLYQESSTALRGAELKALMVFAAALGLLALGAGLTLRAGAVNLAVGPVAIAAAVHYAENGDRGLLVAAGHAVGVAAAAGAVLALLVVGLHVPGWAASLAAGMGVIVFIQQRSGPVTVQGTYDPKNDALYIFGGVVVLAVVGGLLGTVKSVRRGVGRFRPVADPALRRGRTAGLLTAGAIILSMVFAAGAGVLLAAGRADPVVRSPGLELTGLAVGAALLAGTSAFGRRGGVFGTVLAVVLIALAIRFFEVRGLNVSTFGIAATAIGLGLVVTRVVERFGRPRHAGHQEEEEWTETGDATTPAWSAPPRVESWSAPEPAAGRGDAWTGDRWGTAR